ncbi:MAG TPA: NADH-quinone oxidoreductase subunit D [Phycisphaerae bacterium]|nr:NADH-quinone oxidoreductase subunit D [Phycisphaerae bacterium]HOJ73577.1 NADH-quinone oxidoreductase subunit D [Phycisphaerae bacterium]HOM51614.1 NADH-quinone oxidoreductase subunit D [Phycisphaerae bacterium]HON68453.1 NADH-quinone oxidoreductase subunit D [Phycisphaerae bacterium]HOQ85247.1 NADH-quinone oxidoreductase subunit D [Phycisphaerae bacterium]
MLINMGPQHPSTHGVLRVVLRTDGELVLEAIPHIGYLHRCAEKIGENLQPFQFIPKTDRMDYLSAMNNNHVFSLAVEKLAGIQVPERASYIRIIMAELNRIASHLVAFGTFGLDMGSFTAVLYAFREREYILDLFEAVCGARLTYSYITIGGVTQDLPDRFLEKLEEFLDYFEPKIDEYNNLISYNQIFVKRTAGVGVISPEDAIAWGLTGPCLRGSGVKWDLRKSMPYDIYDRFEFDIPVGMNGGADGIPHGAVVGDCWNRYFVRMEEMKQSVRILRQCLKQMPTDGEHKAKVPKVLKLPADEVYVEGENPRGQLGFLIVGDGSAIPYRVKARGPCFCNLSITSHVCRNVLIADVPAIVGSIDIVLGEVDR